MARDKKIRFSGRSSDLSDSPPARHRRQFPTVSQSLLQQAVRRGQLEEVRLLLSTASAADVNAKDGAGRTALMLAVEENAVDILELLLRHGAEPNEGNAFGTSALFQAVRAWRLRCAELLLLGGALVNAHSLRLRHTPLHAACAEGDCKMVELLLGFGADPDVIDYRHRAPLHAAAAGGFADCLPLLLQSGARVDVKDLGGLTPLGVARDAACRSALLEADAALTTADLHHLLRENPAALQQLLDGGVCAGDGGVLRVTYKPLRDIGEAGCPFEAELMQGLQDSGRRELFGHPAVELLLELTRQDGYFVYHTAAKILWCVVFLAALLGAMVVDLHQLGGDDRRLDVAMKAILVTLNCAQLLFLLVKLFVIGKRFFWCGRRWPVILKTVLIFLVVFTLTESEKRIVYGFAVLMAFFELTIALESVSVWKTTRAISSLLHVARSIAEYLFVYSPMLIGFSIAFLVIYGSGGKPGLNNFNGHSVVINMAAMVLGEVDVVATEKHTVQSSFGAVTSTIVFVTFVVLVPIVMLNLLLALTISDTNKFLSKGGAEFLQNLANRTAWNQQAAFMIDRWVHKLKPLMPHCLFVVVARYSLQFKWKSVLPRPAASVKATPRITVDPFAQRGKMARASVAGSSRRFRVRSELRQSLDRIAETRRTSEPDSLPPPSVDAGDAELACGGGGTSTCKKLARSVSGALHAPLRVAPGSRVPSSLRCSLSSALSRRCSLSSAQSRRRSTLCRCGSCADVSSEAALAELLTAVQEKLDTQQTTQQRMVEQLQTIENTLAKLTSC